MKQLTQFLKLATKEDIPVILELLEELFQFSIYSKVAKFNKEDVKTTIEGILKGKPEDGVVILYKDSGVIIASKIQHLFNRDEISAVELAFWTREKESVKILLRAYKYWARKIGCTSIMYGKLKNKNEVEEYIIRKLV